MAARRSVKKKAGSRRSREVPYCQEKMHVYKTVKLPVEILPEKVKAILKNGMLELTLPKAEVAKKVKIEVKTL